jgi:hypothetical protein
MKFLEEMRQAWQDWQDRWGQRGRVTAAAPLLDPGLSEKDIQQGFRRISSANTARDLSPLLQDRMIELAWYLYDRNPLAKRLINLTKIFVLGDGLKVQAKHPAVQEWVTGFWDDPVNRLDLELPSYVQELGIFGEQLYLLTENPIDGAARLWYIDPSEIDQVIYGGAAADIAGADRSVAIPIEIVLKQKVGEATAPRLQPFRPDEDPSSPTFGRPMGNCFYFAINKAKRGARGRSDIFAQADWLDAYEQVLFASADRVDLLNNFVWDVKLTGLNEEGIQDWLKKHGRRPRPGSLRAHNEQVEWQAVAPDLGSQDTTTMMRLFKNHILGTMGFPEHWFAEGGETNLATAGAMGLPTVRTLKERQKFVKHMLISICGVVVDRGIAHGSIPRGADPTVEITAPELETSDSTKVAAAVQQVTTALSLAIQESLLTRETAAKVFAVMVSQLGHEVKAEDELKALEEQLKPNEADYGGKKAGLGIADSDLGKKGPNPETVQ